MTYLYWLALAPLALVVATFAYLDEEFRLKTLNAVFVATITASIFSFFWGLSNLISQ
jgi:hypothetical protein